MKKTFAFLLLFSLSGSVLASNLRGDIYAFCVSNGGKIQDGQWSGAGEVSGNEIVGCETGACTINPKLRGYIVRPGSYQPGSYGYKCEIDIRFEGLPVQCVEARLKTCRSASGQKDDNANLNGCVRNLKQSIECPEGTYKFDSSTINSGRVRGKDIETEFGSAPSGGGTPSMKSDKASKQ